MKLLRILIADDHELVRRGTRQLLHTQRDWKVVGEAATGHEAIEKIRKHKPKIAILDIGMPDLDGLEATRQLGQEASKTSVIILTMHDSMLMVQRALESGARGYVLKSDLTKCLVKAVRRVSQGKTFLTPKVPEIVLRDFTKTGAATNPTYNSEVRPTRRELDVIRLLAEGKTNKEIAIELGIANSTVETHRARILFRLGVHSVAELIHYAIRHSIIAVPNNTINQVAMDN